VLEAMARYATSYHKMLIQLKSQDDIHEMLREYLNYSLSTLPVKLDSLVGNYKMLVILSFRSKNNIIDHISMFLSNKKLVKHKIQK
jgi:hypothetical protein